MPPISQLGSAGTPVILESDPAQVVTFCTPEVNLATSVSFRLLDGGPEQEVHSTEVVKPFVGAAVLVNHDVLPRKSQDAGDRPPVLGCHADLHAVTQAAGQVTEPGAWVWRQVVTSSRTQKKRVERVDQGFAPSFFVGQSLSLCSSDLP